MIRLAHPEISTVLEFNENTINTLVIENQNFFRKFVGDFYCQADGEPGDIVLSDDFKPVNISKNIEIFNQFVPFEINQKGILGKICTAAEKVALNEAHFAETQELVSSIERFMDGVLFEYPFNFEYDKLNITNVIKSVGVSISDCFESELEKILEYMQLVREFDADKMFVFINMRSYFENVDIEKFFTDVAYRKFNILLIDNKEYEKLSLEKRVIIDSDLCEIY